ncbi:MAG: HD domain-containing protein [Candidatus Thorarchaeota archaeon]
MDKELEMKIQMIVKSRTSEFARAEWIQTQEREERPLFDYRFDHVREVVRIAKHLALETGAQMEVVVIASWLHDISKLGMGNVPNHGKASAVIARHILVEQGVELDIINEVCDAIIKHVGLTLEKPLSPIEAQIVWEADKIVKLGASGLIHFIINGIKFKPGLSSVEIAKEIRKFLNLAEEITASMNTEASKKIASMRLENLRRICRALDEELDL